MVRRIGTGHGGDLNVNNLKDNAPAVPPLPTSTPRPTAETGKEKPTWGVVSPARPTVTTPAARIAALGPLTVSDLPGDIVAEATLRFAALAQLKQLDKRGAIDVKGDGKVEIKNKKVERPHLGVLASTVTGEKLSLSDQGVWVGEDGQPRPEATKKLMGAWGTTQLDPDSGTLVIKPGTPPPTVSATIRPLVGTEAAAFMSIKDVLSSDGISGGQAQLGALARTKQLARAGSFGFRADGTVMVKDQLDRPSAAALLSVMTGRALLLDAEGNPKAAPGGSLDETFKGKLKDAWDATALAPDGSVTLAAGHLPPGSQAVLTQILGKPAVAWLKGAADTQSQAAARLAALAELKRLAGNGAIVVHPSGQIDLSNITAEAVGALLSLLAARPLSLDDQGQILGADGRADPALQEDFRSTWNAVELDQHGAMRLRHYRPGGPAEGRLDSMLGPAAATALRRAEAAGTGVATPSANGGSLTRLKQLESGGSIDLSTEGKIKRSGTVDGQELSSLLSVLGGKSLKVANDGRIVDASGRPDGTFNSNFSAAAEATTLTPTGKLALAPGPISPSTEAKLRALLGEGTLAALRGSAAPGKGGMKTAALAELKRLAQQGALRVNTDGSYEVVDPGLSVGDVSSLLSLLAGKQVSLNRQGRVVTADGMFDALLEADLRTAWASTELRGGRLALRGGLSETSETNLTRLLGASAVAALQGGQELPTIRFSALKRLKELANGGAIELTGFGQIRVRDDQVDMVELGSILSILAGKKLSLTLDGRMVHVNGEDALIFGAKLKAAWEHTTLNSEGELVLTDGNLSGSVDAELTSVLGPDTVFKLKGKVSSAGKGDLQIMALAELKRLTKTGSLVVKANGSIEVLNREVTKAQVEGLLSLAIGKDIKLEVDGQISYADGSAAGSLRVDFHGAWESTTLDLRGNLKVADGQASGDVRVKLKQFFGPDAWASVDAVIDGTGIPSATLKAQALLRLKQLQSGGAITLRLDGSLSIKDNAVSRTEVGALLSLVKGSALTVTTEGRIVDENGRITTSFAAGLRMALGSTKLTLDGALTFSEEGSSQKAVAQLEKLLGKDSLASIRATFARDVSGDLRLSALARLKLLGDAGKIEISGGGTVYIRDGAIQRTELSALLTAVVGKAVTLNAQGKMVIDENGKVDTVLSADLQAAWDSTYLRAGGFLAFREGQPTAGELDLRVARLLGRHAMVQLDATINRTGISAATLQGSAFKRLKQLGRDGAINIAVDGAVEIRDNRISRAEVAALLSVIAGKHLTFDTSAHLVTADGRVDADFGANLKATWDNTKLEVDSTLSLVDGKLSGGVEGHLVRVLGQNAVASLKVIATTDAPVETELKLAAFKRLKQLGRDGGIDIVANGSIVTKGSRVDRAEVAALLSVISGRKLNLSGTGQLVYADGKVEPSFGANLQAAWEGTTLEADGTITMVDGKPHLRGQIGTLFTGAKVQAGATLTVDGADSARLDLKLKSLGAGTKIDATGSLVLEKGRLTGAGFTTNLVTRGDRPADIALGGMVVVNKDGASAEFKAGVRTGIFDFAGGVGASTKVALYDPAANKDPARAAIEKEGGVWAQRESTFELTGNVGAGATVMVGPVPLSLGFKTNAGTKREIRTLTLHPNKEDALARSPFTVIRSPNTVEETQAMRPYEQTTDVTEMTLGLGGEAYVGIGAGPLGVRAGGSMYYAISGKFRRDRIYLPDGKVQVRFTREGGSTKVKAVSVSVGLDGAKLAGDDKLAQQAAPVVTQLAQMGLSAQWEDMKKDQTVFDVTIDPSTPHGRSALQHALNNELSEAQYWGGFNDSGVVINSITNTRIEAKTKKTAANLGPMTKENISRWLDKETANFTPGEFTVTEAVDQTHQKKAFLPWNQDSRLNVRFVHETKVATDSDLPDIGTVSTEANMKVRVGQVTPTRPATLADAEALLGVRLRLESKQTGKATAAKSIDATLGMMKQLGFQKNEYAQIDDARPAVDSDLAPPREPTIELFNHGDKSQGKFAVDVEGFLVPKGFAKVFSGRTGDDFRRAYLDGAGAFGSIVSTEGTVAAIERTLGAKLKPTPTGFEVRQGEEVLGTLTHADIERVRTAVAGLASNQEGFSASVKLNVGQWASGKPPEAIVKVDPKTWGDASKVVKRSQTFVQTMESVAQLYKDNHLPERQAEETDADYQARIDHWREGTLYDRPDAFFDLIEEKFRGAVKSDKSPVTALAVMRLAGENHIYGRAQVEMQPEKVKAMIDKGIANVQRFGAVSLLACLGARLDTAKKQLVLTAAPENLDIPTIAARHLFGKQVKVERTGSKVVVSDLKFNPAEAAALEHLFKSVTGTNAQMRFPPEVPVETQRALVANAFGPSATVADQGRVLFDNRGYGLVHFGRAVEMFKKGFGHYRMGQPPPLFPSLVPIEDFGRDQTYDQRGLTARHRGKDARWGDSFGGMEYLRGRNEDLAKTLDSAPGSWVVRERPATERPDRE